MSKARAYVLDESSVLLLRLPRQADRRALDAPQPIWQLRHAVSVRDGERWMRPPRRGLLLDPALDFAQTAIGVQRVIWRHAMGRFRADLAWARTFAFLRDVNYMRSCGLALGGGLDNALVFTEAGCSTLRPCARPTSRPATRPPLLGDLSLLGAPLARVTAGAGACAHSRWCGPSSMPSSGTPA